MNILFLIILLYLVVFDIKKNNELKSKTRGISLDQSTTLKGLFAVIIFIHHISSEMGGTLFAPGGGYRCIGFFLPFSIWLNRISKKRSVLLPTNPFC